MKMFLSAAIAAVLLFLGVPDSFADTPRVAPIKTKPGGQSYGRWAAEWWQWALGVPAATNPILDATGRHCKQRQTDKVWFLAGSFGPDPVVRSCKIPKNTALFFPLINSAYGAFLDDPRKTRTEKYLRKAARCPDPVTELSVVIDGYDIPMLFDYFTGKTGSESPLFNVQLPPGNITGLDENFIRELVLSPTAEEGYYLYVKPLSPGEHTIQIAAEGCYMGMSQNITYYLTVAE